jgi:hypothetical protein
MDRIVVDDNTDYTEYDIRENKKNEIYDKCVYNKCLYDKILKISNNNNYLQNSISNKLNNKKK